MIPFRDDVRARAFPLVTLGIILVNIALFFYEVSLPAPVLESFISQNGVVPARMGFFSQAPGAVLAFTGRTVLWSMFLHGGWFHLLGNMWYLWIFGDNVEDRMGHFRFLVFYLACGACASAAHIFLNLDSRIPSIGASGAIAGVLGAYLVSYPFARVMTIIPLFLFWPIVELPAIVVLGGWFLVQLLNGTASVGATAETVGGIAWWAHIGGFLAGVLLINVFAKPTPRRYQWET